MGPKIDLEAIEDRANAADPGPWVAVSPPFSLDEVRGPGGVVIADVYRFKGCSAFIAHAREDVPALIARVREQAHALGVLEAQIQHYEREMYGAKVLVARVRELETSNATLSGVVDLEAAMRKDIVLRCESAIDAHAKSEARMRELEAAIEEERKAKYLAVSNVNDLADALAEAQANLKSWADADNAMKAAEAAADLKREFIEMD